MRIKISCGTDFQYTIFKSHSFSGVLVYAIMMKATLIGKFPFSEHAVEYGETDSIVLTLMSKSSHKIIYFKN